jgi:hypothetical protein
MTSNQRVSIEELRQLREALRSRIAQTPIEKLGNTFGPGVAERLPRTLDGELSLSPNTSTGAQRIGPWQLEPHDHGLLLVWWVTPIDKMLETRMQVGCAVEATRVGGAWQVGELGLMGDRLEQ